MNNASYIALSKQVGLMRELNSVANNIANSDTAGYRRESFLFSEYIQQLEPQDRSISQSNVGGRFFDPLQGALTQTNGTFDVAVDGEGYFLVETPRGDRITRAGSFMLDAESQLVTPQGYRVLGEGGSPVAIPANASLITIATDGSIAADGNPIGKLGLVTAPATTMAREGDNLFRVDGAITELEAPKMRQGFIEQSNVNPVLEISRLIEVQRAYEMGQQLLKDDDARITKTIDAMNGR
ncbi:MAG: flagellar hook-basal body complex protein [Parvularculaceae bacterium]